MEYKNIVLKHKPDKPLRSSAHIPEKHTAASCSRFDWRRAPESGRRLPLEHVFIFFFFFHFHFFLDSGESWH